MKNSTRRTTKRAAKARLSGAIPTSTATNKKIVFGDDADDGDGSVDEALGQMEDGEADGLADGGSSADSDEDGSVGDDDGESGSDGEGDSNDDDDDDDAVEEVAGRAARASTQRLRAAERQVAKETAPKKKRRKKVDPAPEREASAESDGSDGEDDSEDEEFAADFFARVDSERDDQRRRTKLAKKQLKRVEERKRGKHTTFVVEDELAPTGRARELGRNVAVVPIGGNPSSASGNNEGGEDANNASNSTASHADDAERQLLLSAALGSVPSKSATLFARGSLDRGTSKERSCESRKRQTKNEEAWKRSRKASSFGGRPGRAAMLFARRK